MTANDRAFTDRWHAAVTRLRLETEVMQVTADELPLDVERAADGELWPNPAYMLHRHLAAFHNYTTALNCVQALLYQYDGHGP